MEKLEFVLENLKSTEKEALGYVLRKIKEDKIHLGFGHGLEHIFSGLYVIKKNKLDNKYPEISMLFILHDIGRNSLKPNDESNHSEISALFAKEFLKEKNLDKKYLLNIIKSHNKIYSELGNLHALLILIDKICLVNEIGDKSRVLDRPIITKVGELGFSHLADFKSEVKGLGKKNSSASIQLKNKIEDSIKQVNKITSKYPNLKPITKKSIITIKSLEKYYFNKFFFVKYVFKTLFDNPKIFFIVFFKYRRLKSSIFASIIEYNFNLEKSVIQLLTSDTDIINKTLSKYNILRENKFDNKIFKFIVTNS